MELETAMIQLFIAFGQGAVSVHVSADVIAKARGEYTTMVTRSLKTWSSLVLPTQEYARALGRVAAHLAVGDGLDVILVKHYDAAAKVLRDNSHQTIAANCPICMIPEKH